MRAKALGADFALFGRAFAYAAGAAGAAGVNHAFELLRGELERALGQIGRPRFAEVGRDCLADGARHADA